MNHYHTIWAILLPSLFLIVVVVVANILADK